MSCVKRSDSCLKYKGCRLYCELPEGHDGKCVAFVDEDDKDPIYFDGVVSPSLAEA